MARSSRTTKPRGRARLRRHLDRGRPTLARVALTRGPAQGASRRIPPTTAHPQGHRPPRRDRALVAHRAGALGRLRSRAARRRPTRSARRALRAVAPARRVRPSATLVERRARSFSTSAPSRITAMRRRRARARRRRSARERSSKERARHPLARLRRRRAAAQRLRARAGVPQRAKEALWGLASDGLTLRIVRDNASLTRPAWIEADLARIFTEERYADFAALWLLLHETRFGRADQPSRLRAGDLAPRRREEGTRAREHLARGVEEALLALGQGFLAHPTNPRCAPPSTTARSARRRYFSELLRLVYRLIFLLTVEERGAAAPRGHERRAEALYAGGYSVRSACASALGAPQRPRPLRRPLGGAEDRVPRAGPRASPRSACPRSAASSPRRSAPPRRGKARQPRAAPRHLQALLAPSADAASRASTGATWAPRSWAASTRASSSSSRRSPTTGARSRSRRRRDQGQRPQDLGQLLHPEGLVQVLLDSALEPVIADTIAANPGNPVEALLGLSIVDPACGSGHFLLAAARGSRPRRAASPTARPRPRSTGTRCGRWWEVHLRRRPQPDGGRAVQGQPVDGGRGARACRSPSSTRTSSTATRCSARRPS
jgi:hypothetical protein